MATVAILALTATAAIACSDDDDDASPTAALTAAATSAATKPAVGGTIDISGVDELKDGTLGIGSDIAYAPIEFLDETTNDPVGLDVDLANAIAKALGVESKFENGGFDGLLPALDAERYDAIMSGMTINPERQAVVAFVAYFNAGSGIIVPAGNPDGVKGLDDLCGKKVAVQEGTIQVDTLGTASTKCTDAGKAALGILKFGSDPEAVQALIAGQADAEIADFPVAAYSAKQSNGALEVLDNQIEPAPYGIAVRKSSTALAAALQKAFDQIVADGTYDQILKDWNLEGGKLE
jgi:polar amino acid transport system substrate-binding protein